MTRALTLIRSRHLPWWTLLAVAFLGLAGCAGPYQTKLEFRSHPSMTVADGTRVAAQAMQDIGFWPKFQNEAAGQLSGEKTEKISFGWETMTITLEVGIMKSAQGGLTADATCGVSKNMAYWDEGDECVEEFQKAFEKRLAAWRPAQRPMAPPMQTTPTYRQPAPTAPVPQSPAAPAKGKEYEL
jgi:hypothetical protein